MPILMPSSLIYLYRDLSFLYYMACQAMYLTYLQKTCVTDLAASLWHYREVVESSGGGVQVTEDMPLKGSDPGPLFISFCFLASMGQTAFLSSPSYCQTTINQLLL